MPKIITPLSDIKIRNAKPKERGYKMFDGGGLFLLITPSGGKSWSLKYRFDNKEKKLTLGKYPEISLLEARQKRDEARKQVAHGLDPGAIKNLPDNEIDTFEAVAREWHGKYKANWTTGYTERVMEWLENNVFPWTKGRPANDVDAPEMLTILRRIESRGALETAHRIGGVCSQVFRYAIATGRAKRDPIPDLKGALPPTQEKHMAAITEPVKLGELLRAIWSYEGTFVVQCALKLQPLLFVRPGELRHMEWSEVDFENALWSIPAEKMKMREAHLVPLSKQAVNILREVQKLTGNSKYAFPSLRSKTRPMSDVAVLAALRRMGYEKDEVSGHGFRATARTLLDEVLNYRPDIIEHQLAHAVRDPNGRAYNRTKHLDERRKMMQSWSDYLDELRQGAKVLQFRG